MFYKVNILTAYMDKRNSIHETRCVSKVQKLALSKTSFNISAESLPKRLLQKQLTLMSKSIEADVKCMLHFPYISLLLFFNVTKLLA